MQELVVCKGRKCRGFRVGADMCGTTRAVKIGFEGREDHRTPFASVDWNAIVAHGPVGAWVLDKTLT
jgi:hypothetical protein